MPDKPPPDDAAGRRAANAPLWGGVEAKDAEIAGLRDGLDAERELRRRLELRLAELERRLGMDSSDSGTPSSKEPIGAKEARRARQQSERERREDRRPAGSPAIRAKGWPGILIRASARTRGRRRNAAAAVPGWTGRTPRNRDGCRSSMWKSPGR